MHELLDALNAVGPLFAATAGIIGGLYAIAKNAKRLRSIFPNDQTSLIVELRMLAETRLEMNNTLVSQLAAERLDHQRTRDQRDFYQMSADACERRLAEIRDAKFLEHRP